MNIYIVDETRGCMFSCPFCIQSSRENNSFRAKSPRRIINEIKDIIKKNNSRYFRFGGQMTPGHLLEKIAGQIIEEKIDINYTCFGHVNSMISTDFKLLKESGLYAVFYGIESGSQKLLDDAFHKKTRVADIENVLIETKKAGIKTVASFIYPAPFETEETKKETLDLIRRTNFDSVLAYFPGLYPNTTWHKNATHYGFEITSNNYEEEVMAYKIINVFPPKFWKKLPYKINNMKFKEYAKMTDNFVEIIKSEKIAVFLSDEHFIIGKASSVKPSDLSNFLQKIFYSGDYKEQEELNCKVNQYENRI